MKSILADSFFGNKKFMYPQYQALHQSKTITDEEVKAIFEPYTTMLSQTKSSDGSCTLLIIFAQFIRGNAFKFFDWPFEKFSAWLELSAHVFERTFQKHLDKKASFQYFSQVVVRHSLFRPPHCVNVFNYEEAKQLRDYWLESFVRFFDEYRQCFESELNEIIETVAPASAPSEQLMTGKKQISREDFATKFGTIIAVNEAPKKAP